MTTPISTYGIIPIEFSVLEDAIGNYRSQKEKISRLEHSGEIIRLKKVLNVTHPNHSNQTLSTQLIANSLYGPSYVSYQTALSYHGLIPERVNIISSATLKRAKNFTTPVGQFEYTKVPEGYYPIGINQILVENQYAFLIASPEKALCDLILGTAGLRFQSEGAAAAYLEQDMRIDMESTETWDKEIILQCAAFGRKSRELNFLYKMLNHG